MQVTVEALRRTDGRIALLLGDRILAHVNASDLPKLGGGGGDDSASPRPPRAPAVKKGRKPHADGPKRRRRRDAAPVALLRKASRRIQGGESINAVAKDLGISWYQAKHADEIIAAEKDGDESDDAEDDAASPVLQSSRDGPAPPRMTRRPKLGRLAERLATTPELPDPEDKPFRFGLNSAARARLGAKQQDLLERQDANIDLAAIDAVVRDAQLRAVDGAAVDPRRQGARELYEEGLGLEVIAGMVEADLAVLQYWREADDWDGRRASRRERGA